MKAGGTARHRRAHDLAIVVPLVGTLALMPPFVGLFARGGGAVAGMPPVLVYLFGLWIALILAALLLARRLGDEAMGGDDPVEGGSDRGKNG